MNGSFPSLIKTRRNTDFCGAEIDSPGVTNKPEMYFCSGLFSTCYEVSVGVQQSVTVVGFPQRRPPQQALVRLLHTQAVIHQLLHVCVPHRWVRCHSPDGPGASVCLRHLLINTIGCHLSICLPWKYSEECMKGEGRWWCHSEDRLSTW